MNSIINAASSVSEAVFGKAEPTKESGTEPPNETPPDASGFKDPPYDPGNSVDTAPVSTDAAHSGSKDSATGSADGTPTAIPAPGNVRQSVSSPTDGAGPTTTTAESTSKDKETKAVGEGAATEAAAAVTPAAAAATVIPTAAAENAGAPSKEAAAEEKKDVAPSSAAHTSGGAGKAEEKAAETRK